ncbi:MAG: transglutaminaseTgpA domain-containing protein [Anaerolineae bacterium]
MMEAVHKAGKDKTRDLDVQESNWQDGWGIGALIAIMLVSVTASIATADWAEGGGYTPYAAILGLLFGALVARLRLPGWFAHLLMLLEGTFVTVFLMSSIVQPSFATWSEKLLIMEMRLGRWVAAVSSGGVGTDALLFAILLCALAWLIGYTAAWSVFRSHEPWGAILPSGAALMLNQFYAPPQSGIILMIFLLVAMLLLVRITLLKRQEGWRRHSIRFANDIGFDFITYGVVFSGIVILASWLVPPTAPSPQWFSGITDTVRGPWQDLSDSVSRAFTTVRQVNTGGPTTMFGSSLAMGGPVRLGNRPVLDVTASQGRYWRAVTFDKYTGTGWVSSSSQSESLPAWDDRMQPAPVAASRPVTQTVRVLLAGDNLVVSSTEPLKVSEAVDVRYALLRITQQSGYQDVSSLRLQRRVGVDDTYTVVSMVTGADEETLRHAPTNYPLDIRQRYLQLPDTVPSRVHDLAVQLTVKQANNYDKARAIEQYLRTHITYDENVAAVPEGRDGVDYTLFDRPAGYCNYYASAMLVLAREIGIPARIVSGYSNGESDNGVYHLNEGQAHTWPELYFGSLGWIPFEPTSSKPEILRPVVRLVTTPTVDTQGPDFIPTRSPRISPRNLDNQDTPTPPPGPVIPWPTGAAGIAASTLTGLLFVGLFALGMVQVAWTRRMRLLSPGARAWEEMYRLARLVGYDDRAQATPFERAADLTRALPEAQGTIADVTDLYVRERYGARSLSSEEIARTGLETRALYRHLVLGAIRRAWRIGPVRLAQGARQQFETLRTKIQKPTEKQ